MSEKKALIMDRKTSNQIFLVIEKKKHKIRFLILSAVILGVVLSVFVAGYIMSNRFGWNEKQAIAILRQLHSLEIAYKSEFGTFTVDKSKLLAGPLDEPIRSQTKFGDEDFCCGYYFSLKVSEPDDDGRFLSWNATAWPVQYPSTGFHTFYIDENGIVRGADIEGGKGDSNLPIVKSLN